MPWTTHPVTGTHTLEVDDRTFDVQRSGMWWELWYGRAGRRIRLGSRHTDTELKVMAEDIAESLIFHAKLLEE